jgi:hypothetical protein
MTHIAKLTDYGVLHAAGDDARAFLHAQLTNDLEHMPPGRARWAGWCTAKGRLLATFLVIPAAGGYLLQLAQDVVPSVARRLAMFILRSKVKLADASGAWTQFGAWGDGAAARLAALGLPVPEGELAVAEATGVVVVRLDAERFLVLAGAEHAARIEANAPAEDWTLGEVRAGRARIELATQDQFVPQMVNLERSGGVDFRKGCYPGQEIVARAQYRGAVKRRMYRVRGSGLRAGAELFADGEPAGVVVNAAGDEALAVLQTDAVEKHATLRPGPQGAPLELLPLPYAQ